jgi:hypothetical protein
MLWQVLPADFTLPYLAREVVHLKNLVIRTRLVAIEFPGLKPRTTPFLVVKCKAEYYRLERQKYMFTVWTALTKPVVSRKWIHSSSGLSQDHLHAARIVEYEPGGIHMLRSPLQPFLLIPEPRPHSIRPQTSPEMRKYTAVDKIQPSTESDKRHSSQ